MAPPVRSWPNASPNTQMNAATTRARISALRASGGGRNTPAAMTISATASTTEAVSPWWSSAAAAWFSSPVTQPGSPPVMPTIMSCSACGARFAGVSAK